MCVVLAGKRAPKRAIQPAEATAAPFSIQVFSVKYTAAAAAATTAPRERDCALGYRVCLIRKRAAAVNGKNAWWENRVARS